MVSRISLDEKRTRPALREPGSLQENQARFKRTRLASNPFSQALDDVGRWMTFASYFEETLLNSLKNNGLSVEAEQVFRSTAKRRYVDSADEA